MNGSLSGRLLAGIFVLLLLFFGVTLVALDSVFHRLAEQAMHNRLEGQLVALIAASDPDQSGHVRPNAPLAEPRFATPGSGLYGQIHDASGSLIWQSASAVAVATVGRDLVLRRTSTPGVRSFARLVQGGIEWEQVSLNVRWEIGADTNRRFTFTVAEDLQPYRAQLRTFRVQMLGWFGILTLLLLIAVAWLLRLILKPLRRLEREIGAIESGERASLSDGYPRELTGVALNLNALLDSERQRTDRYRQTLGNLAHELKTPLSIMRTQAGSDTALIERMDQIVAHQLRRARISAGSTLGQLAIELRPLVDELLLTLGKVYAAKALRLEVSGSGRLVGDRGDALELLGNLLDNACKWARSSVLVTIRGIKHEGIRAPQVQVIIEDDGPGWGVSDPARLFLRGERVDESVPGSGLGLDIVRELVDAYDGEVRAANAPAGGARIELWLPTPRDTQHK